MWVGECWMKASTVEVALKYKNFSLKNVNDEEFVTLISRNEM